MFEELLKDYSAKLIRYEKMCAWLDKATGEEKEKQEKHIFQVIEDVSKSYNAIINYFEGE